MKRIFLLILSVLALALAGCGGSDGSSPGDVLSPPPSTDGGTSGPTAGTLILSASPTVIKPDNSDSSEITAYVLNESNVILPDVVVSFSTTGGALSAGSDTTDATGTASVNFTSGAMANGTEATITATAGSLSQQVTVQAADAAIPASLDIVASPTSVKTNDTETSTITVTVLNASGSILSGQEVKFQATGGVLTESTVPTGTDGKATTIFRSGTNKTNSTATITATAGTISANVSILVVGSTLTLSPSTSPASLTVGQKETLTVTAKDASGNPVQAQTITFAASGTGSVNLSATSAITGVNGTATVEVTGGSVGTANLTVQGVGATAIKVYEVSDSTGGGFFHITEPASEISTGNLYSLFTVTVSAPAPTTLVRFITTLGTWDNGQSVKDVAVADGTASAALTTDLAGTATISVTDKANSSITDSVTVAFSADASSASEIDLQARPTVVATTISTDAQQEVQLKATVRNASAQVVGGAPVAFRIENPTGGGEFINPPAAFTNSQGLAEAVFISGSLPAPQGVTVIAYLADNTLISDSLSITIGGTAASITIGRSTEATSISQDTAYSLPMTVQVSDGVGGPVGGQEVSLTVWPEKYLACDGILYDNEDANENVILDPGEDTNLNSQLEPPSSVAGAIYPGTVVTTSDNGLATFNLIYLKANHSTRVRIRATANVSGSETSSSMTFGLPVLLSDIDKIPPPNLLPPSGVCP